MKQQVETLLHKENVLKLSPWHMLRPASSQGPFASPYAPLVGADAPPRAHDADAVPASSDADAAFAAEVSDIFSAFGRR
jgi:hypothetical protein